MIAATQHRSPTGLFLAILVAVGILYLGWRSGRLGGLRAAVARRRWTGQRPRLLPAGVRIRPTALLPTLALIAVVAWLLIDH